jgi:hypothetical protein
MRDRKPGSREGHEDGADPVLLAGLAARLGPATAGGCLAACCALAAAALLGVDPGEARRALERALDAAPGGPIFANARVAVARLLRARSEVVSAPLAQVLRLSGARGLVVLGVNPRLLYPGAAPGRHAVLLASAPGPDLPAWAADLLAPTPRGAGTVAFVDPARPEPVVHTVALETLASAFDGAGREGLLVEAA